MGADIVIVGGGPIGCWTAIQIKKRNPALDVRIYERHPEYQRDHMLRIHKASLTRYSKQTNEPAECLFFSNIANANSNAANGANIGTLRDLTYIRTQDFENLLKAECARLGVITLYQKIITPAQVMAMHPECRQFIAADGAHSLMRDALLGPDALTTKDIFSSVDIKYKSKGQPRYLQAPTYQELDMIVIENIGRQENGETSVALRFLVTDDVYDKIPEATFKAPLNFKTFHDYTHNAGFTGMRMSELEDNAKRMLELRKDHAGDEFIEDSEKITKIKLSRYASKKFAVTTHTMGRKAAWFLVGDAAMGMPFYRSINSGLLQGSQLGALLATNALTPGLKASAYNALRPIKLTREFAMVTAKEKGIKLYREIRPLLGVLPLVAILIVVAPAAWVGNKLFPGRFRIM